MPESKKPARIRPEDEPGYDPNVKDSGSGTRDGGTHIMPMPDDAPVVAGMPRKNRVHTEPGNPGVISPETQIDEGKDKAVPDPKADR